MSPRRVRLAEPRHGSLPVFLLVMTAATGMMDAVSILTLDRVFVANMTGNIVFAGLSLAGVEEFSLATTAIVLVAFLLGAAGGGVLIRRLGTRRGELLRAAVLGEIVLLLVCLLLVVVVAPEPRSSVATVVAATAAVAMGLQNAAARGIGVPDLNTNVITTTMTGLAVDHGRAGAATVARRAGAVLSLLVGAAIGVLVLNWLGAGAAFGLIVLSLVGIAVAAQMLLRRGPDWEN